MWLESKTTLMENNSTTQMEFKMIQLFTDNYVAFMGAGLSEFWANVLTNWITPIFFAAVAVFAIMFLKDRAWMKLIAFVGIAAVVGVLIFAAPSLFGSSGSLKGVAENAAKTINTVTIVDQVPSVFGS